MRLFSFARAAAVWPAVCMVLIASATAGVAQVAAAAAAPVRIRENVVDARRVALAGNVRPDLARHKDLGAAADSRELHHMYMVLKRSPERQAALDTLIEQLHKPGSPEFHHWLMPRQFGERFGASQADIAKVCDWLRSQGFKVNNVTNSAMLVDFGGTAGQVRAAFHTQLHEYQFEGRPRFANTTEPQIPGAFQDAVRGIHGLNNFPLHAQHTTPRRVAHDDSTGQWHSVSTGAQPEFTPSAGEYDEAPEDFYKIYNVSGIFSGGTVGAGSSVAVAEESDIEYGTVNATTGAATGGDVNTFRSKFGVNTVSSTLNMVVYHGYGSDTCSDPGIDPSGIDEDVEASLDAEWATALAPAAKLIFMSCDDITDDGVFTSLAALFDNNLADVVSLSYGDSEQDFASTDYASFDTLWEEAAAQGQSVLISTGDSGSDANDQNTSGTATSGINVSGLSATPLVTAAGGTDFQDTYDAGEGGPAVTTYWSNSNSTYYESARGYVPETVWSEGCAGSLSAEYQNDSSIAAYCGTGTETDGEVVGGSGGISTHYALPSYQSGITGLASSVKMRTQPDISMFASSGFWGHALLFCDSRFSGATCANSSDFGAAGGTSFVAPQLAGVAALLVSYTGERQGVLNYGLYSLARQQFTGSATKTACYANGQTANTGVTTGLPGSACTFYDVTTGDNDVPCAAGSADCYVNSGDSFGVLSTTGAKSLTVAYPSGIGYDPATGIGSVNIGNLFTNWSKAFGSATSLKASATSISSSQSTTLTASVAASVLDGTTYAAPAGTVTFLSGSTTLTTCKLNSGTCFVSVSGATLGTGGHSITAKYGGSRNYPASTSSAVTVTVSSSSTVSTTTALSLSPGNSAAIGSQVSATATVTATSGSPTGTVTFNVYVGSQLVLSSGALSVSPVKGSSTASAATFGPLSTSGQPAGSYTVVAVYSGASEFTGSTSSSTVFTLTKAASTTAVTPATQTVTRPANATLTIRVSGSSGTPTGSVTLSVDGSSLGTFTLSQISSGVAGFTASASTSSYAAGEYPVTVTYSGDGTYGASNGSATVTIQ